MCIYIYILIYKHINIYIYIYRVISPIRSVITTVTHFVQLICYHMWHLLDPTGILPNHKMVPVNQKKRTVAFYKYVLPNKSHPKYNLPQ